MNTCKERLNFHKCFRNLSPPNTPVFDYLKYFLCIYLIFIINLILFIKCNFTELNLYWI